MKTLAIIGARLNSSRLPGKHLMPLAGNPLIARVYERLLLAHRIDEIVLATTADSYNQQLVEWAISAGVGVKAYAGDVNDLMGRLDAVITEFDPQYIVYICGDCPLIEPVFIDHALNALMVSPEHDSIVLKAEVQSLHEGMAFYTRSGWNKLYEASQCDMSREHVGYADKLSPILQKLAIEDSGDYSKIKHRISVDTPADYHFMSEIYTRWYQHHSADSIVDLGWVQQQLVADPELAAINMHVQQKKPDIKYQNVTLFCLAGHEAGIGHLRRCSRIANALQEYLGLGTEIKLLSLQANAPHIETKSSVFTDQSEFFKSMSTDDRDLWILDFHPAFIDMQQVYGCCEQRNMTRKNKIIALDKLSELLPVVDELYIPGFYTELTDPKVCSGWGNYFLPKIPECKKRKQILVMTGGSDALGYGESLPSLLDTVVPESWSIVWIQGPLASAPKIAKGSWIDVRMDPAELLELMAQSEIIISCYGLSLFEALSCKAATLLLPVQHLCSANELAAFKQTGCAILAETLEQVPMLLSELIDKPELRVQLQKRVGEMFSGGSGMIKFVNKIRDMLS